MQAEKNFTIDYQNEIVNVTPGDRYQLTFSDGRFMLIKKYPNAVAVAVNHENITYSLAFVWVIKKISPETGWINKEQVQIIGELIKRKEIELEA